MARRVQKASCIYRPWTGMMQCSPNPQLTEFLWLAGCRRPPVSTVRGQMMQCSPNPPRTKVYVLGLPCVGRLSVGGLARAPDVAGAQGFALFYPRPLRPVRASAPLRKAPTARQPTAHNGARPRPPLPTGPPSSLSHLLSQRDARASTKQSTPGPQPLSRSLSSAKGSPGRRRPVGPP